MEKTSKRQEANQQEGYAHPDNFTNPIIHVEVGDSSEDDIPAPEQAKDMS